METEGVSWFLVIYLLYRHDVILESLISWWGESWILRWGKRVCYIELRKAFG